MNNRIMFFALYCIIYQSLVIGGGGYVVFWLGHSGWWMLLVLILSSSQLGPSKFGITSIDADNDDEDEKDD